MHVSHGTPKLQGCSFLQRQTHIPKALRGQLSSPILQSQKGTSKMITQIDAVHCHLPLAFIQSQGNTN